MADTHTNSIDIIYYEGEISILFHIGNLFDIAC